MKYILQRYSDGHIFKHTDGSYSVETSQGKGKGKNVKEALKSLSEEIKVKKEKKVKKAVDSQ